MFSDPKRLYVLSRGKNGSADDSPLVFSNRSKLYQSLPGYELLTEREKRVSIVDYSRNECEFGLIGLTTALLLNSSVMLKGI